MFCDQVVRRKVLSHTFPQINTTISFQFRVSSLPVELLTKSLFKTQYSFLVTYNLSTNYKRLQHSPAKIS